MAEYAIMPIEDYRRACAAVRTMTGGTEDIKSGELEAQILSIETGVQLPVLVSPGAAADLLAGKQLIDQDGKVVEGAMPRAQLQWSTLAVDQNGYIGVRYEVVNAGYAPVQRYEDKMRVLDPHPGGIFTPTERTITLARQGNILTGDIVMEHIPYNYAIITRVTARPSNVLKGDIFVDAEGKEQEGSMQNNGATSGTVDGLNTTSVEIPEGYTSGGSVTFDDTALAARIDAI